MCIGVLLKTRGAGFPWSWSYRLFVSCSTLVLAIDSRSSAITDHFSRKKKEVKEDSMSECGDSGLYQCTEEADAAGLL